MKRVFLIGLIAISMSGCAMFQPVVKKETVVEPTMTEEIAAAESAATMDEGILIKIDKNGKGQKALKEAVMMLQELHGTPLVIVYGFAGTLKDGTEYSVIKYTLRFKICEGLYTEAYISNNKITGIEPRVVPLSKPGEVLTTKKTSVEKIFEAAGVTPKKER